MTPIGIAALSGSLCSLALGCWAARRIGRTRLSSYLRLAIIIGLCPIFTAAAFLAPYTYTMMVDALPVDRDDMHVSVAILSLVVVPALMFGFGLHSVLTNRNSSIKPGGSGLRSLIERHSKHGKTDPQVIEGAFRWAAFAWVVSMPFTLAYAGNPKAGPLAIVVIPALCAAGFATIRLRTKIKKSDRDILAYLENERLNPPPAKLIRPLKINETFIDPCPVERRLSEERTASTYNMQIMVVTTLIAVIVTLGAEKTPHAWGAIGILFGGSLFLGSTTPRIEHWRTSRRTGAPMWEKEYVDDESVNKGYWFVERTADRADAEGDIPSLKLIRAATVVFLQVGLICAYSGIMK